MTSRIPPDNPVREFDSTNAAGLFALWLGVLVPPLAYLFNHLIAYVMVSWSCATQVRATQHLVPLVALVITLAAGTLAWRNWNRAGREWPGSGAGVIPRSRFLAMLGMLMSAFFSLLILAQWLPVFILPPCSRG
jgi:hypothetical protein